MSEGEITYSQQMTFCGKTRCRKCREGTGHGPYWYAYQTVNGRTTRTYIGKSLPSAAHIVRDEEASNALLRVRLLGPFCLERRAAAHHRWQAVPHAAWSYEPSSRSLLGYLLCCPARTAHHRQIYAALWPLMPPEVAETQLEASIHLLCQIIDSTRPRHKKQPMVRREQTRILLADQQDIWTDIDVFTQSTRREGDATSSIDVAHLAHQLSFYQGDFFPEELGTWVMPHRHTLRQRYSSMLLELADGYLTQGMVTAAIKVLDDLLTTEPANETIVQRLMIALTSMMRRGEAHQVYQRYVEVLKREHNQSPEHATRVLDEALLTGVPLPIPSRLSHLALHEDTPSLPPPPGRVHTTTFVGRDQERMSILSLLQWQSHPHLLLLLGEAGIGKTRLAEEFAREMLSKTWNVIWSQAHQEESTIPYHLWTQILRTALAQVNWLREAVGKQPHVFHPLATLLPELQPILPALLLPGAEREQLRLWEAIHALLILISERFPLLLVIDDAQWADQSSCALLAYLARHTQKSSLIMLATCRETDLEETHSFRSLLIDLQREQAAYAIHLQPLDPPQINELIIGTSHLPELPPSLVEQISERAKGNPLFAEALTRTVETYLLEADAPPDVTHLPLPESIAALLHQQCSFLSASCQRLLSTAAVLGRSFSLLLITTMERRASLDQEEKALDLLEEAIHAGILTEEGTGSRITYHFWHPLFQQYLEEQLSWTRRARLHREAAHALERLSEHQGAEHAAIITHHLVLGGANPERIAHFAELAGLRAYLLSAYTDAERSYQQAREAYERVDTLTLEQQERLSWILIGLGECLRIRGAAQEGYQFYSQALRIREQEIPLQSPTPEQAIHLRALLWCEMGLALYDVQRLEDAQSCFLQGEQLLHEAVIVTGPAVARLLYEQGYVSWRQGDYAKAQQKAEQALNLFERFLAQGGYQLEHLPGLRVSRTLSGDPIDLGRTHMLLGLIANGAGRPKEALSHLNKALTSFEQHDCSRELAIICCNLGDLHLRRAAFSAAQAILRRGLHLAERMGDRPLLAFVTGNLGLVQLRLGNLTEAQTLCQEARTASEQIHDEAAISLWESYLTITLQEQGKFSEAQGVLFHALRRARTTRLCPSIGFALVVLGGLRLRQALAAHQNTMADQKRQRQLLDRAKRAIQHALDQEGLETETRIDGSLLLAEVFLLQDQTELAGAVTIRTRSEAQAAALQGVDARAQSLQARLCFQQGKREQADQHSEQAIRRLRTYGMRLDYARALFQQGLFQQPAQDDAERKQVSRGITTLQEARRAFLECQAHFDLSLVDHVLSDLGVPVIPQ